MHIPTKFRLGKRLVATSCAALTFGACGGGEAVSVTPTRTPAEATLTLDLTTPNAGDGAVLFTITGPSIVRLAARPGLEITETGTTTEKGRTTSTVLLRGDLTSGPIGSLTVRGADAGAAYTTEVLQAAAGAGGGYALRADLTAYKLATQR